MAHRIGPTPQLSQPRGNSAEDVRGLALQAFKDSIDLRSRLILAFPKDGSEAMEAPLPLQQVPTASLPAAADWEGAILYDSTLNQFAYSNGTSWIYLWSQLPAFSVHKNGTDQTGVNSATDTQITYSTEVFDTGGFFASNAWTPPAGLIQLHAAHKITGDLLLGSTHASMIFKNGSLFRETHGAANSEPTGSANISILDRANGTDVYTHWVFALINSGTGTIVGGTDSTWFMGAWLST